MELEGEYVGISLVILPHLLFSVALSALRLFSSNLVPMMALFYLIMAVIILGMHIDDPSVIHRIVQSAFSFDAAMAECLVRWYRSNDGSKRGSNKRGWDLRLNSAAAAHVKHPVSQGLVQMLGVFGDTMIVYCLYCRYYFAFE